MINALLADGGSDYLSMLVTDFLWKAAIVAVLVIIVLVSMVIIYKKVGNRK
ncbi:hypothetical protein [Kutzneria kofuensis]|uniref:Uncharacterized protein n=1 Tax=Kutzneria kofuensis TaxID=103725 RepID=A0A7W9KFS3_9PSEU|nr:hypothetical protein [Kutzneria kofuensis]MBB5891333.1 hypothetical protein [Kutzneria kofuensis]